ncbi:hypothetical protein ANCCAN_03758 [Ancylostoma caninum]|uniref:Uncharacterized protein n=1 Tax=Ancylostoma caninum TaxID=29170 RepID=A0A368H0K4_ANCCA|nr:hypothetical protein ANCCAN_03758 [Ancylostoma caninum]
MLTKLISDSNGAPIRFVVLRMKTQEHADDSSVSCQMMSDCVKWCQIVLADVRSCQMAMRRRAVVSRPHHEVQAIETGFSDGEKQHTTNHQQPPPHPFSTTTTHEFTVETNFYSHTWTLLCLYYFYVKEYNLWKGSEPLYHRMMARMHHWKDR